MRPWIARILLLAAIITTGSTTLFAQQQPQQDAAMQLFLRLRDKVLLVKDYTADVRMKIDVNYMRIPSLNGKLYFKSPNKLRLERSGGISILPRKTTNLTLNNLIPAGDPTVIDLGYDNVQGRKVHVLQVVPKGESEIVLAKVWIDEERLLALQTETTTRDNGTVKMELQFGKFLPLGLPDQVIFHLDVKDYKLPKGVTMDYDEGATPAPAPAKDGKRKKGRIQITYLSYKVNTGLSDAVFAEKKR